MGRTRLRLDCNDASSRRGRRFAARLAAGRTSCPDVELLTSELVTNALRHARTELVVTVDVDDDRVRVEVADDSPAQPKIRTPDLEGGRGLRLVDALADRWGVRAGKPGKMVWFEIDGPERRATAT